MQFGQETDGFHRTSIIQSIYRFLNNLLILTFIKLALFAATNEEDSLGKNVRNMVQQQSLPRFSFQFAATQQCADVSVANFVELFCNRRKATRFKDAHDNAGTPLFLRATAFYTELHALCS